MTPSLNGCKAKLVRARTHLSEFYTQMKEFHKANPYKVADDYNTETGQCVFRITGVKPAPVEWSILVGEFAHNVRSALDHLVWQLVLLDSGTPGRHTMFPIFKTLDEYQENEGGAKRIRGVSKENRTRIEGLQPYKRGTGAVEHPLWLLNVLSNIDKHRTLHVVFSGGVDSHVGITSMEGYEIRELRIFVPRVVEEGTALASMQLIRTANKGKIRTEPRIVHQECFGDGSDALTGRGVGETMQGIFEYVNTEVFNQFSPLFL